MTSSSPRRYTDEEILALRDQAKQKGNELQQVIEELVKKVTMLLQEGTEENDAVATNALAEIQALRNDDS